jgi:hypothetical protein
VGTAVGVEHLLTASIVARPHRRPLHAGAGPARGPCATVAVALGPAFGIAPRKRRGSEPASLTRTVSLSPGPTGWLVRLYASISTSTYRLSTETGYVSATYGPLRSPDVPAVRNPGPVIAVTSAAVRTAPSVSDVPASTATP